MGSFYIVPLSESVLEIQNPPNYWAGGFFLVVSLVFLLGLVGSIADVLGSSKSSLSFAGERSVRPDRGFKWKGRLVLGIIMLISGSLAWFLFQPSSLVLDRKAGTYTLATGHLPFVSGTGSYPLDQIAYATLETDAAAQRFVVVLRDGQRFSLGAYTDRRNQSEAVAAVNGFLHASQPGEPARD